MNNTANKITVGTKLLWAGDMANDGGYYTVKAIRGHYMDIEKVGGGQKMCEPVALAYSPRWKVVTDAEAA